MLKVFNVIYKFLSWFKSSKPLHAKTLFIHKLLWKNRLYMYQRNSKSNPFLPIGWCSTIVILKKFHEWIGHRMGRLFLSTSDTAFWECGLWNYSLACFSASCPLKKLWVRGGFAQTGLEITCPLACFSACRSLKNLRIRVSFPQNGWEITCPLACFSASRSLKKQWFCTKWFRNNMPLSLFLCKPFSKENCELCFAQSGFEITCSVKPISS